jgi:hypothetical protein
MAAKRKPTTHIRAAAALLGIHTVRASPADTLAAAEAVEAALEEEEEAAAALELAVGVDAVPVDPEIEVAAVQELVTETEGLTCNAEGN